MMAPSPAIVNPTPAQKERLKRRDDLFERTRRLKKTLTLDRTEYFVGELIRMEITIENTDVLPVEVLAPFTCGTGEMGASFLKGKEWQNLIPDPFRIGNEIDLPVLLLGGFQKISRSLSATDRLACFQALSEPSLPGLYRIAYGYGGPAAEFRVLSSEVKSLYHVPLARTVPVVDFRTHVPKVDPQTGKNIERPLELLMAILFAGDKYYLVVTKTAKAVNGSVRIPDNGQMDYAASRYLYPFVRIAESDRAIVSLDAHADLDENLFVTWKTEDGEVHSVSLDANREIKR
jgi:hypothetical protein